MDLSWLLYLLWIPAGIFILCLFFGSFFTIHTKEAGVVERLRRFHRVATEGLNFKIPFFESVVYTESLSMQLMDVPVVSKTKDDATITVFVRVQYLHTHTRRELLQRSQTA